jgi:hypothetical protein
MLTTTAGWCSIRRLSGVRVTGVAAEAAGFYTQGSASGEWAEQVTGSGACGRAVARLTRLAMTMP